MPDLWNSISGDVQKLAEVLFRQLAAQAVSDAENFARDTEKQIIRWTGQLARKEITRKNFESLVRGERDLARMELLKQRALAKVTIDTFVNGVIEIIISAALATIP